MKSVVSQPEHEASYQELCALVARHPTLTPAEVLAVASNMVGKLIAMQDQRVMTSEKAMAIVSENLRLGNEQVLAQLQNTAGTA